MLEISTRAKELAMQGSTRKNLRIHFPNGEREDITNKNLVSESMSFTESVLSDDNFHFGTAEASVLDFQTIGVENIDGCEIEASIEMLETLQEEVITQEDLGVYDKNELRIELMTKPIRQSSDIKISIKAPSMFDSFNLDILIYDSRLNLVVEKRNLLMIGSITNYSVDTSMIKGDKIVKLIIGNIYCVFRNITLSEEDFAYPIPLGRFTVESSKRQRNPLIRDIHCIGSHYEGINPADKYIFNEEMQIKNVAFANLPVEAFLLTNMKNLTNVSDFAIETKTDYDGNLFANYIDRNSKMILIMSYDEPGYVANSSGKMKVKCIETQNIDDNGIIILSDKKITKPLYTNDALKNIISEKIKQKIFEYKSDADENFKNDYSRLVDKFVDELSHEFGILQDTITTLDGHEIQYDSSYLYRKGVVANIGGTIGISKLTFPLQISVEFSTYIDDISKNFSVEIDYKNLVDIPFHYDNGEFVFDEPRGIFKVAVVDNSIIYEVQREELETPEGEEKRYGRPKEIPDLHELSNAYFELKGKFLHVDRYGSLKVVSPNFDADFYPSKDLFPSRNLFPYAHFTLTRNMYSGILYDDFYTKPYYKVVCRYKDFLTEEEMEAEYIILDVAENNLNKYQVYDLSDNMILAKSVYAENEISKILQDVGESLRSISYMPCDIEAFGFPFVEAGDVIKVITSDGAFETVVLNRTLDGIMRLTDNIVAK